MTTSKHSNQVTFQDLLQNIELLEIDGMKFYVRTGSSDESIIKDNIKKKMVLKHLTVKEGDVWLDCGGYIGTQSVLFSKLGAQTLSIEADPLHVFLYSVNMQLNGFDPHVLCAGLTERKSPRVQPMIVNSENMNVAANTLINKWKRPKHTFPVPCVRFAEFINYAIDMFDTAERWCIKFDIEGSEIPILEQEDLSIFDQMYVEYHFNADRSIQRAKEVIEIIKSQGFEVISSPKTLPDVETWDWFPAMLVLWCKKG